MDFEEREAWADALTELFPDHSEGRAVDFIHDASRTILLMDSFGRRNYAIRLCLNIKDHFSEEDLQNKFGPRVAALVEADGMVFSSERAMVEDIEKELGIQITLED
jgi:hypothetical protein